MATREIKDAKDLTTNELIYFKSHAKATYMSDGATVEDAINSIRSGSNAYPIENHGSDPISVITPNVFHIFEDPIEFDFSFGDEQLGVSNEYIFQVLFTTEIAPYRFPDTVQWANGEPNFEEGKTYQISIVNNIGLIVCV